MGADASKLINAAGAGDLDSVRHYINLDHSDDRVNCQDERGWSPLYAAARGGRVAVVRYLLQSGARVNISIKADAWTALHSAASNGHDGVVQLLVNHARSSVNFPDENGWSALHCAARAGHDAVVKILLKAAANANLQTQVHVYMHPHSINRGCTPLHCAAQEGRTKVVKMLLDAGADVNLEDKEYLWPPLLFAATFGHTDVAKMLLDAGAKANLEDKAGRKKLGEKAKAAIQTLRQEQSEQTDVTPVKDQQPNLTDTAGPQTPTPKPKPTAGNDDALWLPGATITFCGAASALAHGLNKELAAAVGDGLQLVLSSALHVAGSVATANPVGLILAATKLIDFVHSCYQKVQYCKAKSARLNSRVAALCPGLVALQASLQQASKGVEKRIVQSLAATLVHLLHVLLQVRHLLCKFHSSKDKFLPRMVAFLRSQGHKDEMDSVDFELMQCLTQLTMLLTFAQFSTAAEAVQKESALLTSKWRRQDEEDHLADRQQLESAILKVAGGVEKLQQQLAEQKVMVRDQAVTLQQIADWLQQMNASHSVIVEQLYGWLGGMHEGVERSNQKLDHIIQLLNAKPASKHPHGEVPSVLIPRSSIKIPARAMEQAASGGYGTVAQGNWDGASVAVKMYNYRKVDRGVDRSAAVKEALLLTKANHPYVVRCFGIVYDPESGDNSSMQGSLVMEWVPDGSLANWLPDDALLPIRILLTHQVAAGMRHLHHQGVIHGDLKPANILVVAPSSSSKKMQVKICDFGLSFHSSPSMTMTTNTDAVSTASTLKYTSPERLQRPELRNTQDDVYAFGILMYFLATSTEPYGPHFCTADIYNAVTNRGERPDINGWAKRMKQSFTKYSPEVIEQYADLATRCWNEKPSARPSFVDICSSLQQMRNKL